jgi:hypothetical protein
MAHPRAPVVSQRDALDLGAAEVDADAHAAILPDGVAAGGTPQRGDRQRLLE